MNQIGTTFLDTASLATDSAVIPPAFYPLLSQDAYPIPYNDALKLSLDSAVNLSMQPFCDSQLVSIHLFQSVEQKTTTKKIEENQSPMILVFCLYGLLIALNRLRFFRDKDAVSSKVWVSQLLPQFFMKQQKINSPTSALLLFIPIVLGFALCLSVGFILSNKPFPIYIFVLACLLYGLFKWIYGYLSALLLDVTSFSVVYMQKKWVAYYNLLLLLVPIAFCCFFYPASWVLYLFCLFLLIISIYLIISMIIIFSPVIKLHGIFLYFCTLEIVPVILIVVYFLRY